jgi:general secretion pathway protein K
VPRDDKGFVLVLVLGAAILLAIFAAGFSATVRSYVRSAATRVELAQARAIADGGINLALVDIAEARAHASAERRFELDGPAVACETSNGSVLTIRVEDEAKKINLNTAKEDQLAGLFEQLGASSDEARRYAESVMDFRDGDDEAQQGGSERAIYAASGPSGSPKNAPFDQVVELTQVAGLPVDLAMKAAGQTTVYASAISIFSWVRMPSGVSYVTHAIATVPPQQRSGYTLVQWRRGELGDPGRWSTRSAEFKGC